ncbi:DNA translocase FtsK, partial [Bacteroides acidifaciens]
MAKKKLDKETDRTPSSPSKIVAILKNETVHFVIGLMLVIFSVYLLLAFSSFFFTGAADQSILDSGNPADLSVVDNHVKNYAGSRGAQLASYLINDCFGISSFFILVFLAVAGLKLMRVRIVRLWKWFIGCTLLLIWFSIFFGFTFMDHYQDSFIYLGGMHGYNVSRWLVSQVGVPGVWMILLITAICFFIYISARTVVWLRKLFALSFLKRKKREEVEAAPAVGGEPEFATSQPQEVEFELKRTYKQTPPAPVMDIQSEEHEEEEDFPVNQQETEESSSLSEESEGVTMVFEPAASNSVVSLPKETAEDEEPGFEVESAASEEEYQGPEVEPYNPTKDLENYRFPTIDLMKHFENDDPTIDMDEQNANKDRIINTLRSFGIEISTIKATVGPTVTLYEITPEQGVRISKIRGLEDDIALSLSADGIRIIAPIPGKGTIGIEVPNKNPKIVSGQSVIGSKKFQESKFDLPIVLGKTITNEVFMFDLCKMPHVLVAGATGQGKSVGLNAIITSLLYKKHPAELKFVLVDPKKVEFSIYSVIENHFLAKLPDGGEPIITDVTKVVQTLNSVCVEMDTRYDLLKMAHVRNVKEYNEKFVNRRLNPEKGHKFMPYIVVVIDEFGDLIMTAGKEVELPIARIAQLARAVGIHMIIATQRPTTNIITGTIKANFPARIAFRVSAMMDS